MLAIAGILLLGGAAIEIRHLLADPRVILLQPDHQAVWIRPDQPFVTGAKFDLNTTARFEIAFERPPGTARYTLEVAALRRVKIYLDGNDLFDSGPGLEHWKTTYDVQLPLDLTAGKHQLRFDVSNYRGPSLVRVRCDALKIFSGPCWQATFDGDHWLSTVSADQAWEPVLPAQFQSPSLRVVAPFLILLFIIMFMLLARRRGIDAPSNVSAHPADPDWGQRVRWGMLLAWVVLACNNLFKVPLQFGYDVDSHYLYILYVAEHLSLPRPDAGWQYFQAPLYYMVSAVFARMMMFLGFNNGTALYALRLLPLACGVAAVELTYRAARLVYPGQCYPQATAIMIGGLLPMNLYMAQSVSNEPMAAVFGELIVLCMLNFVAHPSAARSTAQLLLAGAALGLAYLTKVSSLLWVVPMGMAILWALKRDGAFFAQWCKSIALFTISGCSVGGWYALRSILLVGTPVYTAPSMQPDRWWQDPGYRTADMFLSFGHALSRPIYNGTSSIWDSLYATMWGYGIVAGQIPWNLGLMWSGLWLALIPLAGIFAGIFWAIFSREDRAAHTKTSLRFCVMATGCFMLAILYVYLTLPIYSCAKASYMLGTAPCIGLLAAAGFDLISGHRMLRAAVGALLICWAVTAYLTYIVVF
jgi:hypothetical protein